MLAAGELTFAMAKSVHVFEARNQSTGYCPLVNASWDVLARVLDRLKIPRPFCFMSTFEFRRCTACGAINLIKGDEFCCAVCSEPLSLEWNFPDSLMGKCCGLLSGDSGEPPFL